MNKIETNLKDCYILEAKRFGDDRGYFSSITKEDLEELGFKGVYQKSESKSVKGTVRGLHFQKDPYCQAKLVYCTNGAVLDVVVDMRKDSPTYGQYTSVKLTPENGRMLYVPRGFAHGFVALTDDAIFNYFVDNKYMPRMEGGIAWDDKEVNIPWQETFDEYNIEKPLLSAKDSNRVSLRESEALFYRKPKRFLITGVTGQLGYDIEKELNERGENDVLALSSKEMDITNREQVMNIVKNYKPDVIFHCAAWTAVDKAEVNPTDCENINVNGTKNLVDASLEIGAKIIYTSTDYVFDGKKDIANSYAEEDIPNPLSVYGKTKYLGEEEVRRNPNHFISRISWVFGINGNNFVKTMLKLADNHNELNVVADQIGSPTYTVDLAKVLVEMAFSEKYGTYNVTNEDYCSWAEFAKYIMESNNKNCHINPVTTEQYYNGKDMSSIAYRPKNSKLDKNKLEKAGFLRLPTWQDAVDRFSKELENNKVYKYTKH